jgi:hypothetical protein
MFRTLKRKIAAPRSTVGPFLPFLKIGFIKRGPKKSHEVANRSYAPTP